MGVTTKNNDKGRLGELEQMKKSLEIQLLEMSKTVEKQKEQIAMAGRDTLTGLRNRQGVENQIDTLLSNDKSGTFFIIDMDNFKSVNDTYGHMEGDRVLERFANALSNISEDEDIVARIGGDEFIIFTPGNNSKETIRKKATILVRNVEREIASLHIRIRVTISMGIAIAPFNGMTFEELYLHGDKALYSVKSEGKNSFKFYDDMKESKQDRRDHKETLVDITSKIKEKKLLGSFMIEFEGFANIYHFLERIIPRENREVQSILFTIENENNEAKLKEKMHNLENAVVSTLRRGDVGTIYSDSQIMILLLDVNRENAYLVVERIMAKYDDSFINNENVKFEIQQLIPEEEYD